eukprot:10928001-Karenia_brevis.AAC.1
MVSIVKHAITKRDLTKMWLKMATKIWATAQQSSTRTAQLRTPKWYSIIDWNFAYFRKMDDANNFDKYSMEP